MSHAVATERINVRVQPGLKASAEQVFRAMGLNLSDGINVYLRRVVADHAIPFQLEASRAEIIGGEAAAMEAAGRAQVQAAIAKSWSMGAPVARYDADLGRPYMEYSDGRRDYDAI